MERVEFPKIVLPPPPDWHAADNEARFGMQRWRQFEHLSLRTDVGRKVAAALDNDPRVVALAGKHVNNGRSGIPFSIVQLNQWFLWRVNEVGFDEANKNLETYLEATELPVTYGLWVSGLTVDAPIDLGEGVLLVPGEGMPQSYETAKFCAGRDVTMNPYEVPYPAAALTTTGMEPKIFGDYTGTSKPWVASAPHELLERVAWLLNALSGIRCVPFFATAHIDYSFPNGPFQGSGGMIPQHDVLCRKNVKFQPSCADEARRLVAAFTCLPKDEQARFVLMLLRLSQAKRREDISDKILDLGIAMEMMLLADATEQEPVSHTFRLRGSWLLGATPEERTRLFAEFKAFYGLRSQVAHSGKLRDFVKAYATFPQFVALGERVIQRLILGGMPDWRRLVLGG